ncbi:hypothetical protein PHYBLDRAFT_140328 [Phycomyces blakesleeanus NRRL 1555(-)]|uniref:Uncharacterized protein n=1 Tax=Phycomyces blakesleeanus (strain ATCC 8743b / DSM 1359 / FGSC 10004 / NBRC 33097 / NRRL 1555) TaxID=763407 RepID=A0A167PMS7_PHYB8|nr:hypothetical protein PHYBLDRAFT_140328 [Phycomyces blakesleeanus NRRL 1555(-)]OAD78227.1 hypothetical protein PHYBLDRAFT_140328 [Phycomyces blakesleeanus NRRL 1555(-)]|eukprot:XP_018296267.1 hypothetical protein PHYBLDRAFT_140328 [Phycomyces blakesleeanus NRRL 1555(-)]
MGKISTFKADPENVSKHARSGKIGKKQKEPTGAKARIAEELKLLQARGKAISLTSKTVHKVKKTPIKKMASVKKQKKMARAMMVADKEEIRIEKAAEKAEKRKVRKQVWENIE